MKKPIRLPFELQHYNRAAINFIFILVFFVSVILNMDQGAMAAASVQIKADFQIDNFQFGGLQSLSFLGILVGKIISFINNFLIGSIISPFAFRNISEKIIISISLCLTIASLLLLTVTNYYSLAAVSRFIFGVFQIHITLYFPAWIDTFAATTYQKTNWLSIFLLSPFFSYFFGYLIAALIVSNDQNWEVIFYTQSCLILPCIVGLLFTPEKYTDIELALDLKRKQEE